MFELLPVAKVPKSEPKAAKKKATGGRRSAAPISIEEVINDDYAITNLESCQTIVRAINIRDLHMMSRGDLSLSAFNVMGGLAYVCMIQFVVSEGVSRALDRSSSPFIAATAAFCLVYIPANLLKIVRFPISLSGRVSSTEGSVVMGLMVVLSIGYAITLLLLPSDWLDVDAQLGAAGLQQSRTFWRDIATNLGRVWQFMRSGVAGSGAPAGPLEAQSDSSEAEDPLMGTPLAATPPHSPGMTLAFILGIAVVAGGYSGLLLLPVVRAARCVNAALYPQPFVTGGAASIRETMPLTRGPLASAGIVLSVALPVATALLWVRPLSEGLLGLQADARATLQGAALIACGMAQTASIRPLLQGHLNTALMRWYHARYTNTVRTAGNKYTAHVVSTMVGNTSALLPCVAIQLLGQALLLAILGVVLVDSVGLGKERTELAEEEHEVFRAVLMDFVNPPADLARAVASALGLAAVSTQAFYMLVTLSLHRNGLLQY